MKELIQKEQIQLLEWADTGNKEKIINFLNTHTDVNINFKDTRPIGSGRTLLNWATHQQDIEMAQFLLSHGADPNMQRFDGYTPFHSACLTGNIEMVQLLFNHGADVHTRTTDGYTPLHCAAHRGHTQVAQLLLDHGADVHAKANDGDTPLSLAISTKHTSTARLLVSHGANIPTKNKKIPVSFLQEISRTK